MNLYMDEKVGGKMSLANMPFCQDTIELPENYVPSSKDIICGRGKSCYDHMGNRRFRVTVAMNLRRYVYARSKMEKSQVVASIVDNLRESSSVGGFIKKNHRTGRYMAVSDALAREKVGHALRDALNCMKRAQRDSQFKAAMLEKNENLNEAEDAIFKSLDLCRRREEAQPDQIESSMLTASFDAYEQEPSAPFIISV